jgi:predicted RNA-binding protein YlxR (DUF448 family)
MKFTTFLFLASLSTSAAFAPASKECCSSSSTALGASRRDILSAAAAAAMVALPQAVLADGRPTYLTEPTDEFKENEAKSMEFKRQQMLIKKDFTDALAKLLAEEEDEDKLVTDILDMKYLIARTGGLPLGIKKLEVFKMIRTKKAKGFWPTRVEVA